jgi:general secretion pathway protein A
VKTALIAYPSNTFEELVSNLLVSLDQVVEEDTKQALLDQLNRYLTEKMDKDKTLVVIVDEAQNLPSEVMEELGTFYEGGRWVARLQMILVGAPELMHKINTPRLKQFGREIGVRCEISPLTDEESKKYIDHRLKLAGSRSREIFTPEALSMIVRYARGFPRVINILCDNAFMIGYGLSKTRIDEDMVRQAIKDMEAPTQQKLIPRRIVRAVKENRLVSQVMSFFREKFLSSFYH